MDIVVIKNAGLALAAALATSAATLAAFPLSAHAAPAIVVTAEPTAVRVSHADLNLLSQAGVARLNDRVRNAAEKLCVEPNTRQLDVFIAGKSCVRIAIDRAEPQIARAIDSQRFTQAGAGSK